MSNPSGRWSLIVPVKRLDRAKTRLAVAHDLRGDLALAMAIDTVQAALDCEAVAEVVVVTDDPRAAEALTTLTARVVGDRPDAGLNPALVHGASVATCDRVAALSSDLPALRPADLHAALAAAADYGCAVAADAEGSGTTLLAATTHQSFVPAFGTGSFAAHRRAGAADITELVSPSVRHDVDTIAGLLAALALGVGPATTKALAGVAWPAAGAGTRQ